MGVNHVGARGPREHREAPVLRGDKGDGAALILDELRRRQVSRSAKACRVNDLGDAAYDRLRHGDLFYRRPSVPPRNLGAERKKLYRSVITAALPYAAPATALTAWSASCQRRWPSSAGACRTISASSAKAGFTE